MANTVPFVQAACIAENVLIETEGVASVIRMVDTFSVHEPADLPGGMKVATTLNLFVSLKSGDVKGESEIEMVMRPPSGKIRSLGARPVILEGGIHGTTMKITLNVVVVEYDQPYWLDVMWGLTGAQKTLLTSIPFRFTRTSTPTAPTDASAGTTPSAV